MIRPKLRVLSQPAPEKDKLKRCAANSNASNEIRERLINLAHTIRNDAYAHINSKTLLFKIENELEILRQRNKQENFHDHL